MKLLTINPGSTSTKIAVFDNEVPAFTKNIAHSTAELQQFETIISQYAFREEKISETLATENIDMKNVAAIVGRGGLLHPIESGVYEINEAMLNDLQSGVYGEHASNLGGILAYRLAQKLTDCRAFVADPVVVDEMQDVARVSGLPLMPRRSVFHALNQKMVARKYAAKCGVAYEDLNLVVAHLGGGISVAAHRNGRVIDTNQALGGYGAFSPERAGTLDTIALVNLCFSGKYTQQQIQKMLVGQGGVVAHLGTNDMRKVSEMVRGGNEKALLVLQALSYNVSKEIGAMIAVLHGKTDAVILTGGIAYNEQVTDYIRAMIEPFAKVEIFAGEDEMEALALAGLRVLRGEEAKRY